MVGSTAALGRRDLLSLLGNSAVFAGLALPAPIVAAMTADAESIDDIALLRDVLTTLHPGLYRYNSPRAVAGLFDRLDAEWRARTDLRSRFLALSRMLAALKCGHSYANFYNQKPTTHQQLFTQIPRLPFLFRWIDGAMVLLQSQGNEEPLPPGTIVTGINGVSARAILGRLLPYVRADGSNDGKRIDLLSCTGQDQWETFDIFFGNLFPGTTGFNLDLRLPDGRRSRVVRAPISLAERQLALPAASGDRNAPMWTLTYQPDGCARLTMPSWAVYNSRWDWQAFLDQSFADMEQRATAGLVIDLRSNEGGLDCGDAVIARLIDTVLEPERYERRVRYRSVPAHLLKYMDTWDKGFATLGAEAAERPGGFYALPAGAVARIEPKGPRFRGRVAVLVEPGNSSATARFAAIVKNARLGTLVGDTTGGNQRGINGGGFYFLRLPQSGLEVDVPLIGTFPSIPKPDAGIAPDVRVIATARDIATGRDPVLAAAEAVLR